MKQSKKDTLEILTREIENVKANRHMTPDERDKKVKELQNLIKEK